MMNSINPNDLLAKRIIDIAKHNRSGDAFVMAVSAFFKFPEDAILSLHTRILAHQSMAAHNEGQRRGSNHSPLRMLGGGGAGGDKEKMEGMDHDSSDILAAEPRRKGGLMRSGGDVGFSSLARLC
jgi:pre-mRNA-splicing factor ATP-dependent RNA helicase DHX38/PRP16